MNGDMGDPIEMPCPRYVTVPNMILCMGIINLGTLGPTPLEWDITDPRNTHLPMCVTMPYLVILDQTAQVYIRRSVG